MSNLDFSSLDIPAMVERHTSTRLHPTSRSGKQFSGACPYDDCSVDTDGFMVWPDLTSRGCHYYCRGCRRSGDIVKLLRDINGWTFQHTLDELGVSSPYGTGVNNRTTSTPTSTKRSIPLASSDWQVKERNILQHIYPYARKALHCPRARAYLAQRGIPYDLAYSLGLGYIPSFADISPDKVTEEMRTIRAWCDRLIFPLTSPHGQGFTGRSLLLWEDGRDENEHKKQLDSYNVRMTQEHGEKDAPRYHVSRWKTTYPAGYFHAEVLETSEQVIFTEGSFDACALIAGGITDVVATCGTSLEASVIPVRICDATLAYDGDEKGNEAAVGVRKVLRRVGITTTVCTPPNDDMGKDWSERYRLHGMRGIEAVLQPQSIAIETPQSSLADSISEICVCGAPLYEYDFTATPPIAYCEQHWQEKQQPVDEVVPLPAGYSIDEHIKTQYDRYGRYHEPQAAHVSQHEKQWR